MLAKAAGSNQFKIGQGDKTWNDLPFVDAVGATGPTGPTGPQGPSGATAAVATQSANGLMSAADKKKLDGIAAGAQVNVTQTSVTGNAGTATKLQTARTISLTGPVTGSATFDGSANASIATSIDFSTMPTDKFEAMLKSIRVPMWLTTNTNFYVDGTSGSDVLSSGRGLSATAAFKTIQACINYICDNYNLSRYNVNIWVKSGDYNESLTLTDYNTLTGIIIICPWNGTNTSLTNSAIYKTVSVKQITASGSTWNLYGIHIKYNETKTVAAGSIFRFQLLIVNNSTVSLIGCKFEFDASKITLAGTMMSCYCIQAGSNGVVNLSSVSTNLTSSTNHEFITVNPSGNTTGIITALYALNLGQINISGYNVTQNNISVTGIYKYFAYATNSGKITNSTGSGGKVPQFTPVGTVTGQRYRCDSAGTINTGAQGASYFPGNTAGTVDSATYSWYV